MEFEHIGLIICVMLWLVMAEMTTNRLIMGGKGAKERPVLHVISRLIYTTMIDVYAYVDD